MRSLVETLSGRPTVSLIIQGNKNSNNSNNNNRRLVTLAEHTSDDHGKQTNSNIEGTRVQNIIIMLLKPPGLIKAVKSTNQHST